MHLAAGQPPQKITIDGAEHQLAAFGALSRAGNVIENPCHFRSGKIGVDDQPGFRSDRGLVTLCLQSGADLSGAAVLPDNGAMNRLPGGAVPHHGGLALVGDPDRGDVPCGDIGFLQRLAAGGEGRIPDILRLVLDPAGGGKVLREFSLRDRRNRNVAAKDNGARGRGALIDGQHKRHELLPGRVSFGVVAKASGLASGGQYDCLPQRCAPSPACGQGNRIWI